MEDIGVLSCGSLGLDEDILLLGEGRIGAVVIAGVGEGAEVLMGDFILVCMYVCLYKEGRQRQIILAGLLANCDDDRVKEGRKGRS